MRFKASLGHNNEGTSSCLKCFFLISKKNSVMNVIICVDIVISIIIIIIVVVVSVGIQLLVRRKEAN